MKPTVLPANPNFSSGPCTKRPGWTPAVLTGALVGRSHRSAPGKEKLAEVIDRSRRLLGMPEDWRLAIVPASDTGAVEIALWSLLGARGVDVLAWESFGASWAQDVQSHLGIKDVRLLEAGYGSLPDLSKADADRDLVFVWNGTTSGVCLPHGEWISEDRRGLVICDATSAVFGVDISWSRLDVVTWSWQKAIGGEGAHGMLALGPRAVERLLTYVPSRPLPKVFRLTRNGALIEGLFRGETLNTPSMLCVEDALDALAWVESIGGLAGSLVRTQANATVIKEWVARTEWIDYLARDPAARSPTSICLAFADPRVAGLPEDKRRAFVQALAARLDAENAARDIANHRDAPPSLRIWAGPTVERSDLEALMPWLDWAFEAEAGTLRAH
ncbi:MAG: phosphoserine transaminase [Alphaproteobacteria bacterium]|nr:phosphoserine transaminase [Alphaproteobacteria bacterium]MCY4320178.1 phosphoserine transaminase [Alphaproteobacteria bacterium]